MADYDFEPPSFSLGLDLDLDSETQPAPPSDPLSHSAKRPSIAANLPTIDEDDGGFGSPVRVSSPPRALKRLRRGPPARLTSEVRAAEFEDRRCNVDDEIEGFSSEEDWTIGSLPSSSLCSSSKPSLYGQRVVMSESGRQCKPGKGKEVSGASASVNLGKNSSNVLFPDLTISPLRRFQLIDSDSDDPSIIEDTGKEVPLVNLSSKNKQSGSHEPVAFSNLGTKKASLGKSQNEDLWRDFCSEKSTRIPTPVFDEVCEEYFTNLKDKNKAEIDCSNTNNARKWDGASLPSAHSYFYHNDSRIRELVRKRLPHFVPLEVGNNQENKQQNESVIDYMGQFGNEGSSRKTDQKQTVEKRSRSGKAKVKKSKVGSKLQESDNWVDPRSSAGLQKNASSRRVQAVSGTSGHWYTGSDGRRVYVNKNGQEMTGKIAYMHYRKESGKGFKKSKKKAAPKKKK